MPARRVSLWVFEAVSCGPGSAGGFDGLTTSTALRPGPSDSRARECALSVSTGAGLAFALALASTFALAPLVAAGTTRCTPAVCWVPCRNHQLVAASPRPHAAAIEGGSQLRVSDDRGGRVLAANGVCIDTGGAAGSSARRARAAACPEPASPAETGAAAGGGVS